MTRCLAVLVLVLLAFPALADDLTISYISRLPELDYVWGSTKPRSDGWPLAGSQVTWRAHVRSWLPAPKSVPYVWRVDGFEVARGAKTLAANAETPIDLVRFWSFDRSRIELEVDGKSLEVFTDAISVGFWVEQSFYDDFRANQHKLGIGSTGFEDWAQRTIALFNDMAALAIYPETPDGVLDRWRLQKIVIVPNDSLPLSGLPADATLGASGSSHPDHTDRSVDLMWGFRTALLPSYNSGGTKPDPQNAFYAGTAVLHELGHARSLVDVYAWDVLHDPPEFIVDVTEAGQRITGSGRVHRTGEQGFMNKQYTHIDRYSAILMNFLAGRRAVMGNYNEPRNFGEHLNDFPAQNRVRIRDANGNAVANADVLIYQAEKTMPTERWYGARFDDSPDLVLKTDANGQVLVGRSPFSPDGKVTHAPDFNSGVAIVKVKKDNYVAHGFLESRSFNLEYWRGHPQLADHELIVGRECTADGPRLMTPAWDEATTGPTTLQWLGMADATQYRLYVSTDLGVPRLINTRETSVTLHANGRIDWWVEADLGVCGTRRSGAGRFVGNTTPIPRRRSARH